MDDLTEFQIDQEFFLERFESIFIEFSNSICVSCSNKTSCHLTKNVYEIIEFRFECDELLNFYNIFLSRVHSNKESCRVNYVNVMIDNTP